MAGSLVLNVEILGEFKKLADATKASEKSLGSLDDSAKKISKGINTALGAIGIGFSLNFLVDQFKASTKAAIEDAKSKTLLTEALKTNLNATEDSINGVEKFIGKLQITTSIADDKLRPAFSKLAIATKDTDQAMRLMSVATDVAAGTGKNLDAVVQAMSRALAGSETALFRLVPSIKGADDPLKALEETFKGAAEAAANTDPYARMEIIFGELQEQVGTALLPILEEFSTWLATPEGQEKLQGIVEGVIEVINGFSDLVGWIDEKVVPVLEQLTGEEGFGAVITAVTNLVVFLGTLKIALMFYTAGPLAPVLAGLALIAGAMYTVWKNTKDATTATEEFQRIQGLKKTLTTPMTPEQVSGLTYRGLLGGPSQPSIPSAVPKKPGSVVQQNNITINGSKLSGPEMAKAINDTLKSQGSKLRIQ